MIPKLICFLFGKKRSKMDIKGKYKDVSIRDLILMLKECHEKTPEEDKEEIKEMQLELARRK